MTKKQPDRFEQIVERAVYEEPEERDVNKALGYYLRDRSVTALLRRQHNSYVRIVKRVMDKQFNDTENTRRFRSEMLAALTRYAKGKGKP